ncbi:NACHT and WD repeat domain-containing protein 2-like [Pelodytes ibericus]
MGGGGRLQRAILCGDVARIPMEEERGCIQVFLCADPLDSERERKALRTNVYPKIREYCRHFHGLEFQVLDPYDGIHPANFYSSGVRKTRLRLLKKCLTSSAGPCFVALIGEEYGKPCLPTEIESEEFDNILHTAKKHKVCTKVLERWYLRDENSIPPVYSLLDKEETPPSQGGLQDTTGVPDPSQDWMYDVSQEMKKVLDIVVPLCVNEGSLNCEQAEKYFNSALEEELLFVSRVCPTDLLQRCLCYIHRVPYKAILRNRTRLEQAEMGLLDGYDKLCHIRDTLIPSLALCGGMHVYSTTTTCDVKVGYTEQKEQRYVTGLCQQFYADMLKLIQDRRPVHPSPGKTRTEVALQHLSLCDTFSELQQYESKETEYIKGYILQDTNRGPLVVFGEPGCGKTVLLASCAKKIRYWHEASDPVLVIRFLSMFGEPIHSNSLLRSLCQQLSDIYQRHLPTHLEDPDELGQFFADVLCASTKQRPLVLILDAIDHLNAEVNILIPHWLTRPIPQFTKIILSVTQEKCVNCDLVKSLGHKHVLTLEVRPLKRGCNESLKLSLIRHDRKITSGQQVYVNRALASDTSPLHMLLLLKEAIGWKSHREIDEMSLGRNVYKNIENLFHKLELKYGYAVLSRALSYISLSRSGIAEVELVDIMSADDMVLGQLYHLDDTVGVLRVPDWLVANILLDLKSCLSQRIVAGFRLMCWTNGLYQKVVWGRYLSTPEVLHQLHANMCHYFSGRWACGRSKPISLEEITDPLNDGSTLRSTGSSAPAKIYVDSQLPSQPWVFAVQSGHRSFDIGNVRKAYELPFHLKECRKLDNLYNDVLMALPYYKVLLKAGLLHLLLDSMEEAARITDREEVYVIWDLLKEGRCLLRENPDNVDVLLQSKMVPLVSTHPCLLKLVKQLYYKGRKSSSVVVLNTPLIKAQVTKVQFQETSSVVGILEIKAKPCLIVVFENGNVYTWQLRKNLTLVFKFSPLTEITAVFLENEGRCLALCTKSNSFVVLDCSSWAVLHEFTLETEFTPKSFHLTNMGLFLCFKNSPIFRLYKAHSGEIIDEVVFSEEVTFFARDKSGKHTIIGQRGKIFIYDNQNFSLKIDLPVDLLHSIGDVYIQQCIVYIIDREGNINVWDIKDPEEPQLLDELYTAEENNEMISSEITPEWLLICRSQNIDVWRTSDWEKSQFKPPTGSKLLCCVLSHSCEEIIAAVENGSSIFIWDRESGQCMSMLHLGCGELSRFTKCLQLSILVGVTTGRLLMVWDLKSVVTATSFFQTGRPIESLLLCPQWNAAYTSDGSDMVCRWHMSSTKIRMLFLHGDRVEMMKLTANGDRLVTAVVSGDLYVWVTETGENVFYVQGNPVSQLLVTPNDNLMVTLCENGVSRVWNPTTGNLVCNIHVCLRQALITPEGTFLVGLKDDGLKDDKLLAVNLWSGFVHKKFHMDNDKPDPIVAFQCLRSHPNFLILLTCGGDLYTWDVVEETVCHQVKLPIDISQPTNFFQVSFNGKIIVLTVNKTVNVLNTQEGKLGIFYAPGTILHQHLTDDGEYLIYVCHAVDHNNCDCGFHSNPILHVRKVFYGEEVGHCHLGKMPSSFTVSREDRTVCLGFEDGSLGLYSIANINEANSRVEHLPLSLMNKGSSEKTSVTIHLRKQSQDIVWSNSTCAE